MGEIILIPHKTSGMMPPAKALRIDTEDIISFLYLLRISRNEKSRRKSVKTVIVKLNEVAVCQSGSWGIASKTKWAAKATKKDTKGFFIFVPMIKLMGAWVVRYM